MMIKPPSLTAGNTIGIVAPARKVQREQLAKAISTFESWGLHVKLGKNLFSDKHHYLAGTDNERLNDLQDFIDDNNVHGIVAARGGYGSTRIIDSLNLEGLKKHPKWIVGFSDITALQLQLASNGVMSIHGTMPILFDRVDIGVSLDSLKQILFNGSFELHAPQNKNNRLGVAAGRLIGGNLSLIADAIGTSADPDTEGAILVIEEIDEYYYRIDRMLTHLKRAGKLKNLAGLVVGHFTAIKESELAFKESVEQIVLNAVQDYKYPVGFNFPTGHENPNISWIQGEFATFTINEKSHLTSMHLY